MDTNKAVKWEYLYNNPLTHVEYLKQDDSKKIRSLTEIEVQQVLDNSLDWFYPILFTMLYTGMREGEVIHLEWGDVDFDKKVIHIQKKEFWLPKSSGRGIRERDIALTDGLVTFLKMHKLKAKGQDNWVFHVKCCKDITVAQAQLGHTDIRTTMRYADMLSDHQAKAANMLNYSFEELNVKC